ncbi:MAG: CDP-glycerol glycerophosphotransferase family protein [Streptosporangiaceae bacterium]
MKRLARIPLSCALPFVAMLTADLRVASAYVLLPALVGVLEVLAGREAVLHSAPIATRNVDLSALRLPAGLPSWVRRRTMRVLELGALLTGVAGLLVGGWLPLLGLVPAYGYALAASALIVLRLGRGRRMDGAAELYATVQQQIDAYAPEVVLYFSGAPGTGYQVNKWLSMLDRLEKRSMILMRQPPLLAEVAETARPVVCISRAAELMGFELPTVGVVLYPAHSGANSHLLRMASAKHVFIGPGDSDEVPIINPLTNVYDEVWVAGPAGRERYARADVGVREETIVEVGRPQLTGIRSGPTGSPEFTVLYAPTWEGWKEERDESSVAVLGSGLVRELILAGFRVVYKPHPLTGSRDPRVRTASERIARLTGQYPNARTVLPGEASLIDCFNEADLMIADVSSVIADFLASGRPYAVTCLRGLDDGEFRQRYPTAAAGYLLDPACARLAGVLELVRGGDPMAGAREELSRYLLGPAEPDSMTLINDAVNVLMKRAES